MKRDTRMTGLRGEIMLLDLYNLDMQKTDGSGLFFTVVNQHCVLLDMRCADLSWR